MSKKAASTILVETVKFMCPAGQATPSPPIGPVLGSRGLKAIDFCKEFNARTAQYIPGIPMQIEMVVQRAARTFNFTVKSPPTSWMLMRCAGVEKGAAVPGKETVGKPVTLKHVYEIAKIKQQDPLLRGVDLEKIASMILNQAKSVGIQIVR